MCSVPSMCSRIIRTARRRRRGAAHDQAAVLVVGAGQDLGRVGDQRDQVAHLTLHVGHRAEQPRRPGGLGDADVEADVGAAVLLEVLGARHLSPAPRAGRAARRPCARPRASPPGLDRDPVVEHRPGALVERLAGPPASGGCSATKVPPFGPAARPGGRSGPGWSAPGAGSSGRSAVCGQLPLRRQLAARGQQPEPDRGPQPLDRLLEGARRPHRHEHSLQCGVPSSLTACLSSRSHPNRTPRQRSGVRNVEIFDISNTGRPERRSGGSFRRYPGITPTGAGG